jgi:hypothetical protein
LPSPSDVMPWISGAIALGGLAVAALSQWIVYRERTAAYRLRLYDKQLEALQELSVVLTSHYQALLNLLTRELIGKGGAVPLSDEAKMRIRDDTAAAHNKIGDVESKWQVVLPDLVKNAIAHYRTITAAATAFTAVAEGYEKDGLAEVVHHNDPSMPVAKAYEAVAQAMRRTVGTDPLSTESLRMMGRPPSQE